MSERFRPHIEHEIINEEEEKLDSIIADYLSEQPSPLTEITDQGVDDVLSRYIEKGPELSPEVRASLRSAIKRLLGIRLEKPKQ